MTKEALMFLSGIRGRLLRQSVDAVRPVLLESNINHLDEVTQEEVIGLAAWYNKVIWSGHGNTFKILTEMYDYDRSAAHILKKAIDEDDEWMNGERDYLCATTLTAHFANTPDKLLKYRWTKYTLVEFKMTVMYSIFTELCPDDRFFLDLQSMMNYYAEK